MKQERFTIADFNKMFPDEDACLEVLKNLIYPDGITCRTCKEARLHPRRTGRKQYSCDYCGTLVAPLAGTIFEKSTTPLKSWFYAMHLMASTRCGISAKQLERELGVTYKTAWRIFNQVRKLMAEDTGLLGGEVEMDETYHGGRRRGTRRGRPGPESHKVPVFGIVQRAGKVAAMTVPNVQRATLLPHIIERVLPASTVYTDELNVYNGLDGEGYKHRRINHSEKVYVSGDVHTNTIEGFWSLTKRGIGGVYHSVSAKHLQGYLNEYAWRYNERHDDRAMF